MPLSINLPDGRKIYLDESTGNIVGEEDPETPPAPQPPYQYSGAYNKNLPGNTSELPTPPAEADEFDPSTHEIVEVKKGPGGTQYQYRKPGGGFGVAFVPDDDGSTGGVSATTAYAQQQANARDAAGLAEEQRQFNEMFGFNKAKYNQDYELDRGKTLLGLGSRPDTLTRYLYALRGQLPPQQLGGTPPQLPGFQNLYATPAAGTSSPVAPPTASAPAGAPAIPAAAPSLTAAPAAPVPPDAQPLKAGGFTPTVGTTDPNMSGGRLLSSNERKKLSSVQRPNVAPGQAPKALGPGGILIYGTGGVIPEPVMGQGMMSGRPYLFGEMGPETVVPGVGQEPMGDGSYATGGTIGYDPELFNPSSLPGIVNRGFNSPGVPLLPSVGIATGGGQSLVPSAQRMNSLLPSEQSTYAGFLQDEAGVQSEDVFSLAERLSPKVRGLSTPRYV